MRTVSVADQIISVLKLERHQLRELRNLKKQQVTLEGEIEQLAQHLSRTNEEQGITHFIESSILSNTLTDKHMLSEETIAEQATPFEVQSGVYFLVKDGRVVYVGQSIYVPMRLLEHSKCKDFDSYAFIQCPKDKLNILESLYIHALAPEYQGRSGNGTGDRIAAPCSFSQLLVMGSKNGNK